MLTDEQKSLVESLMEKPNKQNNSTNKRKNIIEYFLKKYNLSESEYYDLIAIELCKAAQTYDKNKKTKFSTYAYQCIKNKIFLDFKHNKRRQNILNAVSYNTIANEEILDELDIINVSDFNLEEEIIANDCLERLYKKYENKPRQLKTVELLSQGYGQKEIAEILHTHQSFISETKIEAEKFIKNILK